jgi:hypothetical protein
MVSNSQGAMLLIKNNYVPQDMSALKAAGVAVPAKASQMELMSSLVNGKFSAQNIITNSDKLEAAPLLRDIAIMTSMKLWMDMQSIRMQKRMLSLLADQQVMAAQETIGKKAAELRGKIQP